MSAISLTPCTYFNIKFENNPTGIFHPGDTINGNMLNISSSSENKITNFRNRRALCGEKNQENQR